MASHRISLESIYVSHFHCRIVQKILEFGYIVPKYWCKGSLKRCAYLYDYIAICFVLTFIGTRLYNSVGKHIVKHLFKTPLHQYLGTMYPKPKTFKWIYNKNAKQKRIPNIFREHNIYLFQSTTKKINRNSFVPE